MLGAKWRVGDGKSIRVYTDFWLLGNSSGKIISNPLGPGSERRVSELIDVDTSCWKTWLIDTLFLPFEAQSIKSIPLCVVSLLDYLYWPRERNGVYLVTSS